MNPAKAFSDFINQTNQAKFIPLALLFLLLGLFQQPVCAQSEIATAQLVIGQNATVFRQNQPIPIETGMQFYEGDQIETTGNSHVHIKFIDGAIASLRPNSKVEIECYQIEPSQKMCMKLNLLKGTIRKISGQASESHKDRFRLNTPVAAIGVRGTDFVTQANASETFVKVFSGEIVAASFGNQCFRSGLGVCLGDLSRNLTPQDGAILKIEKNKSPVLIKEKNLLPLAEAIDAIKIQQNNIGKDLTDRPDLIDYYLALSGYQQADAVENVQNNPLNNQPLVFGNWSAESDAFALAYPDASENREVTVGDWQGAIWRAPITSLPQTKVSFLLQDVKAEVVNNTTLFKEPLEISHSNLLIDFAQSEVKTSLGFDLDGTPQLMTGQGKINSNGIFVFATENGGNIAGAVSNEAEMAGYMATEPRGMETINIKTLWQANQ